MIWNKGSIALLLHNAKSITSHTKIPECLSLTSQRPDFLFCKSKLGTNKQQKIEVGWRGLQTTSLATWKYSFVQNLISQLI